MGETELLLELFQLLHQAVQQADRLGMPLASAHICTAIDYIQATAEVGDSLLDAPVPAEGTLPN